MALPLLTTDQTSCYNSDGTLVDCSGLGQDASLLKVQIPASERFLLHGDLVTDTVTGAIWTQNANPAEFPLDWKEAHAYLDAMADTNCHGLKNWRLPPRKMLFALVSHDNINPSLPSGHPFKNVFFGNYWTADTCSRFTDQAWHIHLGGARVSRTRKQDAALVWPVSLIEKSKTGDGDRKERRFVTSGETVLDTETGLVWYQDANPAQRPLSWQQGLTFVKEINHSGAYGVSSWRMPNIRELESLVDLTVDSPALTDGHPFRHVQDVYWSSTTSVYETRYAWGLYFRDGMVGVGFKPNSGFAVWPVSSRQMP